MRGLFDGFARTTARLRINVISEAMLDFFYKVMKLKLETQDQFVILTATESISVEQTAVLHAGLNKLFLAGKKRMILDLTALPAAELRMPQVLTQLIALKTWAASQDAELFVASPIEKLGDVPGRAEALQLMSSPVGRLMSLEATCKLHLEELERQKTVLEKKLAVIDSGTGSILKARKENSDLKKRIAFLESHRARLSHSQRKPLTSESLQSKLRGIELILETVLLQQGLGKN
jgi:hypothetical protein